ncbi:hypothetical protein D3C75_1105540 [compost metagenome]
MRQLQILLALHLLQAGQATLKLELQLFALVNLEHRGFGGDHQFDVALIEFIHQRQEAAGGVFLQLPHNAHIIQHYAVIEA